MEHNPFTLKWICGNTGCLVMRGYYIPFYRLDESRIVLMDSGLPQTGRFLIETLEQSGLRVAYVLTSHIHVDHVGAHALLKRKHGAVIYVSEYDVPACSDLLAQKSYLGIELPENFLRFALDSLALKPDRAFPVTDLSVEIESARFQILPLPGHAPSHHGFVTPDGVAYLGDALVKPTDRLPAEFSYQTAIETIRRLPELEYPYYISAHAGIYEKIDGLAEDNLNIFRTIADTMVSLCETPVPRKDFPEAVMRAMDLHARDPLTALSFETMIDRFLTYLVDSATLKTELRDRQIIISKVK